MDPASLREIALLAFLITLNGFFAAAEVSIIAMRRTRLRQMLEEGVPEAPIIQRLCDNSSRFLATIQVGITLVGFFAAASTAVTFSVPVQKALEATGVSILVANAQAIAVTALTLLLAFLVMVLGELVPKALALRHAEGMARFAARPLYALATLAGPLVHILTLTTDSIVDLLGGGPASSLPFVTEEEIKTMVDAGEEVGVIEEQEKEMIYSVFALGDITVREIMIPRIDMVAVEVNTPVTEVAQVFARSGHTRLPVYEGTRDNVIGIVHIKDLMRVYAEGTQDQTSLRGILRPPYFVPESKKADELIRELQEKQLQMAIVVDEYGGTAGLVTMEDILEEVVGEIRDEHDREETSIEKVSDEVAIFNGLVPLMDVNETLDIHLEDESVDTIGGFVLSRLGKIPTVGDVVDVPEAHLEVIATSGRRIKKVRVTRITPVTETTNMTGAE
jgi:putative hemolysin